MSGASAGQAPTSLFGLCEACGTTPSFRSLASSLGYTAIVCVLSIEFAVLSWWFQGWVFFAIAVTSTIALYAGLTLLAQRSLRARYRTDKGRQRGEWAQNLAGSVLGFLIGLAWMWIALTWGR